MSKLDFLVLGNAACHYILKVNNIPDNDDTIYIQNEDFDELFFGGTGINICYNLARLGSNKCGLLTTTDECYGIKALEKLQSVGVDTSNCVIIEKAKSAGYLIEDEKKRRLTILTGMKGEFVVCDPPDEVFSEAGMVVFSIDCKPNVDAFADKIEKTGATLAFAMRSDKNIFTDDILRRMIPRAKLLFCNEYEQTIIENALSIDTITDLFKNSIARVICVTKGMKGITLYVKDGPEEGVNVPITEANCVEDCTGAGDGFAAGYLYGYSLGMAPVDCARLGATLSSFIIERIGCITGSPTLEQLVERYNNRPDVKGE